MPGGVERLCSEADGTVCGRRAHRYSRHVRWIKLLAVDVRHVPGLRYCHVNAEHGCIGHAVQSQYGTVQIGDRNYHLRALSNGKPDDSTRHTRCVDCVRHD